VLTELRDARPPDAENAERRGWAVTSQAFASRAPRRRRAPAVALAFAVTVIVLVVVGAFTPPGDAVADFVRRVVDPPPQPAAERPVTAPGPGRILVAGQDGLRIVGPTGAGRSLGRWSGATWSPQARFIGAWRGRRLAALGRDGSVRWTLPTAAKVLQARWSPEGFHVAYLLAGQTGDAQLRVVAGNGLRDRLWRTGVAQVAPAFRPNARRTLAWVRSDGRVPVADVFTGEVRALSTSRIGRSATAMAWTGDGRRLAVLTRDEVRVWNVARDTVRRVPLDGHGVALAASPRGTRLAVLTHDDRWGVSTIALLGRGSTMRVRGELRNLTFSPDGRTLLATWPSRRRWLVLGAGGETLDATPTPRGAPGRITGWTR
jgi:hypothetical protein